MGWRDRGNSHRCKYSVFSSDTHSHLSLVMSQDTEVEQGTGSLQKSSCRLPKIRTCIIFTALWQNRQQNYVLFWYSNILEWNIISALAKMELQTLQKENEKNNLLNTFENTIYIGWIISKRYHWFIYCNPQTKWKLAYLRTGLFVTMFCHFDISRYMWYQQGHLRFENIQGCICTPQLTDNQYQWMIPS